MVSKSGAVFGKRRPQSRMIVSILGVGNNWLIATGRDAGVSWLYVDVTSKDCYMQLDDFFSR